MRSGFKVLHAFFKTALYAWRIVREPVEGRVELKRAWGNEILSIFGVKLEVKGETPGHHAQILIGNHLSYLDIPVLMSAYPSATFISKDDLLTWPIIGKAAVAGGTIFVNRKSNSDRSETRKQINDLVREKQSPVVIFPSGTTGLDETKAWKKGAFEIATDLKVPMRLFKIEYSPARLCAYIDDDQLVSHMLALTGVAKKKATLTWLEEVTPFAEPIEMAHTLRKRVSQVERSAILEG